MESLLDRIETELNDFVENISRYRPVSEQAQRIAQLDVELVQMLDTLKRHYDACKRYEQLRAELQDLDRQVDATLIELAECRKLLETNPGPLENSSPIDVGLLLEYATKITKFTHAQPGAPGILPWPTEDQMRRGMLATLVVNSGLVAPEAMGQSQVEVNIETDQKSPAKTEKSEPKHAPKRPVQPAKAPAKLNLDLFDSDEED